MYTIQNMYKDNLFKDLLKKRKQRDEQRGV